MQVIKLLRRLGIRRHRDNDVFSDAKRRAQERYRRAAFTSVSSVLAKIVQSLVGLIVIPLCYNYLGEDRFGFWVTSTSMLALLNFVDLGIGGGIVNTISKAEAQEDQRLIKVYLSTGVFVLSVIGIILLGLALLSLLFFPYLQWVGIENSINNSEILATLAVVFVVLCLSVPLGVLQRLQLAKQQGYLWHVFEIVSSVLGVSALVLMIKLRCNMPMLMLAVLGAPLLGRLVNAVLYLNRYNELRPSIHFIEFRAGLELLSQGSRFLVLQVLFTVAFGLDAIFIATALGATAVAPYAIAYRLFSFLLLGRLLLVSLWPAFSEASSRGDFDWVKKTLWGGILISVLLTAVCSTVLAMIAKPVISVWVGSDVNISYDLLGALAVSVTLLAFISPISYYLNSQKHLLSKQLYFYIPAALISVWLKFKWMPEMGVPGVLWASIVGFGIFHFGPSIFLAWSSLRQQKLS